MKKLSLIFTTLTRDIVDYRNIQLLSFFNKEKCQFLINIYSNSFHTTIDFLSNKVLSILNLLYMKEDFNIRDTK